MKQGLEVPSRSVPMKIAIPLFQAATLEENDDLQDMWARLLVNAADTDSGVDVTRSLVTILQDFGPLEARLLGAIYDAPTELYPEGHVLTTLLPNGYQPNVPDLEDQPDLPPDKIQIGLWNLIRLGCISSAGTWDSLVGIHRVTITTLGKSLIDSCTLKQET